MTPLRQKMIEAMILKGFAENTQKNYLEHIKKLAQYFKLRPDRLTTEDIRQFIRLYKLEA